MNVRQTLRAVERVSWWLTGLTAAGVSTAAVLLWMFTWNESVWLGMRDGQPWPLAMLLGLLFGAVAPAGALALRIAGGSEVGAADERR